MGSATSFEVQLESIAVNLLSDHFFSNCAKLEGSIIDDSYDPVWFCPSKFEFSWFNPHLSGKLTLPSPLVVHY